MFENRNARITERHLGASSRVVRTTGRDPDTMNVSVQVRERTDVATGRSLGGIVIRKSGIEIELNGFEANTLLRVLDRAKFGE